MDEKALVTFPWKTFIIPDFPFRGDNSEAKHYPLLLFPLPSNFDLAIKKPAKKSFRVLAGISDKP